MGGGGERRGAGGKGEEVHRNFLELIIIIGTGGKSIVCACIPLAGWGWPCLFNCTFHIVKM